MSDVDINTQSAASSPPAAPPPGAGDPQGSAPAPADTAASGPDEAKGQDPKEQSRRTSREFANQRRENRELHRTLGRMEAELEALRSQRQSDQQPADGQPPRQERPAASTAAIQALTEHRDAIMERVEDAGDGIEGFDKVLETIQAPSFPGTRMMLDFLGATDKPAQMAQWLADNPREVRRISLMSDVAGYKALERAEAKLGRPASKTTNAPPPVPTVGGRSTPSFDPDKASMEDYAAHWKSSRGIK